MELIKRNLNIPVYWVTLILSFMLLLIFVYLYWQVDQISQPKLASLYAGFASAFLVAFFQLSVSIIEALKLRRYEKMGVVDIRSNRKSQEYYSNLIKETNNEILVIGVTASRFMEDFASNENSDSRALIDALSKGVIVKILLPKFTHLKPHQISDISGKTLKHYAKLKENYANIYIQYYDHIPAQSLVATDSICIVGPVFPDISSKNTPSIVMKREAILAKGYLQHFEQEWKKSDESPD